MLKTLALYKIFGIPLLMYSGIIAFILLFLAGTIGALILKGKTSLNMKTHINLARAGLMFGIVHVIMSMSFYF